MNWSNYKISKIKVNSFENFIQITINRYILSELAFLIFGNIIISLPMLHQHQLILIPFVNLTLFILIS